MAASRLAPVHFWLHSVGTLVAMVMLYLFFAGSIAEDASIGILIPISTGLVIIGTALFGWNLLQNAK